MKRIFCYLFAASAAVCAAETLRAQETTPTTDPGVKIGETVWATRNVGDAGKFVANPEDFGGYFTFEEAKTACPDGWRPPIMSELTILIQAHGTWATVNDIAGRRFGPGDDTIFLPAAGFYENKMPDMPNFGFYWSSSPPSSADYDRFKSQGSIIIGLGMSFFEDSPTESFGSNEVMNSLRCVRK